MVTKDSSRGNQQRQLQVSYSIPSICLFRPSGGGGGEHPIRKLQTGNKMPVCILFVAPRCHIKIAIRCGVLWRNAPGGGGGGGHEETAR